MIRWPWPGFVSRLDHIGRASGLVLGIAVGSMLAFVAPLLTVDALFFVMVGAASTGIALALSSRPMSAVHVETEAPHVVEDAQCRVLPRGGYMFGSIPERGYKSEIHAHHVEVAVFQCMLLPVTRRLFAHVMGRDPGWPEKASGRMPANNVSWLEAIEFCNALSRMMGVTPCYEIQGNGQVVWHDQEGYRLPTEIEWEYACRGGSWVDYCFGSDRRELSDYAWYEDNAGDRPRPVGRKHPNGWGLHDVHGNVWEWCWDEYSAGGHASPASPGPGTALLDQGCRVVRGGAFFLPAGALRSPVRRGEEARGRDASIGFRCVRGRYMWGIREISVPRTRGTACHHRSNRT